jgi:hypothetical protein
MKEEAMTQEIWQRAQFVEPANNLECHIRGRADMIRLHVIYKKADRLNGMSGWIDIFASPESGAFFSVRDGVIAWCPAESIPDYPEDWDGG